MFRFHKAKAPKQLGETITTLTESANRVESIIETAQKEKSRLHLRAGNVCNRVAQIRKTAASFEQSATKISDYDIALKTLGKGIDSIKKDAASIHEIGAETAQLLERLVIHNQQAAEVDKLQKYFAKISLSSEELKAKEKSNDCNETLNNRAIDDASKLEELIQQTEHLCSVSK
jgi:hypothetical protein